MPADSSADISPFRSREERATERERNGEMSALESAGMVSNLFEGILTENYKKCNLLVSRNMKAQCCDSERNPGGDS